MRNIFHPRFVLLMKMLNLRRNKNANCNIFVTNSDGFPKKIEIYCRNIKKPLYKSGNLCYYNLK